jgi:hypothetical protein
MLLLGAAVSTAPPAALKLPLDPGAASVCAGVFIGPSGFTPFSDGSCALHQARLFIRPSSDSPQQPLPTDGPIVGALLYCQEH